MNRIDLATLPVAEISALIGEEPLTLFVGSGVSQWPPTQLPTGRELTDAIFSVLFGAGSDISTKERADLERQFSELPFEVVCQQCPEPASLRTLFRRMFADARPNPLHRFIAAGLRSGRFAHVITTNYDCALDKAIEESGGHTAGDTGHTASRAIERIVGEPPADVDTRGRAVYFKIHGTADDRAGETIVFRLTEERVVSQPCRRLMESLIEGRRLLLIGYSGRDFEICPELQRLRYRALFWNAFRDSDASPSAMRVLNGTNGTLLIGDMLKLLASLGTLTLPAGTRSSIDVRRLLHDAVPKQAIDVWRLAVLGHMSRATLGLRLARELDVSSVDNQTLALHALRVRAECYHQAARYRAAARQYEEAFALARAAGGDQHHNMCHSILGACDNWRCFGAWSKASHCLSVAESLVGERSDFTGLTLAKRVLLLRDRYRITLMLRRHRQAAALREQARSLIAEAKHRLMHDGDRITLQQMIQWESRFGLEPTSPLPDAPGLLPPDDGYAELAFPMARMMCFRDEIRSLRRLTPTQRDRCRTLADLAIELGVEAEIWKLVRAGMLAGIAWDGTTWWRATRAFARCEYSPVMRGWQLLSTA